MTVVNLRRVRKQKARADKEKQSAENRARFGESKRAKEQATAERLLSEKTLENHKRGS